MSMSLPVTPQFQFWHEPELYYWAVLRHETAVGIVSIERAVYRSDREVDLTNWYRCDDSRLLQVMDLELSDLLA